MIKKCIGCGLLLQDTDKNALGYTPNMKNDYCMRCFRLKNYGEKKEESIDIDSIFKRVNKAQGVSFFLVDFLNINESTIALFKKINIPKALIISKSDTLRKDLKYDKIILWLKKVYDIDTPVLFISNKLYMVSSNIFKVMDEYHTKTAYILGITNAGKSTFINGILKSNHIHKEILASNKPNTTLDFIKIRVGEYTLFDTPGFSYENDHLPIVNKEIKPISLQIKGGTTLVIEDYHIYFSEDNRVVFYAFSEIKRVYQNTLKNGFSYHLSDNQDIVFPGIGFLNVKNECQILVNKDDLEVRMDFSEVVL